jgi:glycerol uptake facilitator-like aquaporin
MFRRTWSGLASIAVGFALAAGVFNGGPLTSAGVNPARALGLMIVPGSSTTSGSTSSAR